MSIPEAWTAFEFYQDIFTGSIEFNNWKSILEEVEKHFEPNNGWWFVITYVPFNNDATVVKQIMRHKEMEIRDSIGTHFLLKNVQFVFQHSHVQDPHYVTIDVVQQELDKKNPPIYLINQNYFPFAILEFYSPKHA